MIKTMHSDLSKNTPEELKALFGFVNKGFEHIPPHQITLWVEWLSLISGLIKEMESKDQSKVNSVFENFIKPTKLG